MTLTLLKLAERSIALYMKIIINGANGAMGRNVLAAIESGKFDAEAVALVSRSYKLNAAERKYPTLDSYTGEADCVIDFSNHEGTQALTEYCVGRKLPVVVATTGHTDYEKSLIKKAAESTAVFLAANTSVGVAVLAELVKTAVAAFPDADVEIIERHHRRKADAPSGTALMLANSIKEVRPDAVYVFGREGHEVRQADEIGIHALRYGNEVGTHEIIISNGSETITLKHEAESRVLFAEGALKAAAYIAGRPAGLYGMRDLL